MKKLAKKICVTAVLAMTLIVNGIVSMAATHNHTYCVYDKIYCGGETVPCVTPGCQVTIKYYTVRYRCSCGDEFVKAETDYDNHSMYHRCQ